MRSFDTEKILNIVTIVAVIFSIAVLTICFSMCAIDTSNNVRYKVKEIKGENAGRVFIVSMQAGYEPGDTVSRADDPIVIVKILDNEQNEK